MNIPTDKLLHFIAGTIAAVLGVLVLPWLPWPLLAGAAPGAQAWLLAGLAAVLREVYNRSRGGPFDWRDVASTLLGAAPVVAVV